MVNEIEIIDSVVNSTEISDSLLSIANPILQPLMTILKAVGIVVIVYVIFLLIKGILSWRDHSRIKKILKNVEAINEKLGVLVGKKPRDEGEKPNKNQKIKKRKIKSKK